MNISLNQNFLPKILLAMLVLFSMALFVVPVNEVDALDLTNTSACFNPTTNTLSAFPTTNTCPTGSYKVTAKTVAKGFCLLKENGVNVAKSPYLNSAGTGPSLDPLGKTCLAEDGSATYGTFTPFPKGSTTPVTPTNTNTGNNTNTTKNTNGNTGGGVGGGTQNPTSKGDCEDKFHKVGPLCVPNNPFNNSSIAGGNATATGLALRIIRIMLYFAAIVAVIMAIIGGYQVMTAGGNPTQAASGRKTLTNAVIGLAIILLAFVIVQVLVNFITK